MNLWRCLPEIRVGYEGSHFFSIISHFLPAVSLSDKDILLNCNYQRLTVFISSYYSFIDLQEKLRRIMFRFTSGLDISCSRY